MSSIKYNREGDKFVSLEKYGNYYYEIYSEDEDYLVITSDRDYYSMLNNLFDVVGIDKRTGRVIQRKIDLNQIKYNPIMINRTGECVVLK